MSGSIGQAIIPKRVRDHLNLKPGDRIKFFMHPDGRVVLLPTLPASALRGFVAAPEKSKTIKNMTEAVRLERQNHHAPDDA